MTFTDPRVVLLVVALAGVTHAEDGTVVQDPLGVKLDRAVQRATSGGYWGAVLVAKKGEVLLAKGYGFADYGQVPNTPRTLFELASTSKQFTAAAILRLEQDGKLKTSDPISKFFKDVPKDKADLTVHQLLTHTSGLSPNLGLPYAWPGIRDEYAREMLCAKPLDAKPGERFAYCNAAYSMLAGIVEIASGQSFEAYSREKLFAPAGMPDTGFVRDPRLLKEAARTTSRLSDMPGSERHTAVDWSWGWGYRGMGGVVSTALDLLAWDRALRGDEVLNAETRRKLFSPVLNGYACGWQVQITERGTTKASHSGSVAGYGINLSRYLEEEVVIAVLSNGKGAVFEVEKAIEELLFPKPRVSAEIDVSPYELSKWQAVTLEGRLAWVVAKDGDAALLRLTESKTEHVMATIRAPQPVVKTMIRYLEHGITLREKSDRKRQLEKKASMDAGAYLGPYAFEDGKLSLAGPLEIMVMPQYQGRGAGGKKIVDKRVTFVLLDPEVGQWSIMAKMNVAMSKALLADLRKVSGD